MKATFKATHITLLLIFLKVYFHLNISWFWVFFPLVIMLLTALTMHKVAKKMNACKDTIAEAIEAHPKNL